jgi:predicted nucleic acid-binding protein
VSQVLDASMALAWLFLRVDEAEKSRAAEALGRLDKTETLVPGLWFAEIANGVLRGERAGMASPAQSQLFLNGLAAANIVTDSESPSGRQQHVLALARAHGLTAYDAAYLDLALRTHSSLLTFDRKLAAAARASGLDVFGDEA